MFGNTAIVESTNHENITVACKLWNVQKSKRGHGWDVNMKACS